MSKITLHEITEDDTDAAQTMMHATRSKFMSMIDTWLGDLTQIVLHENNIQINVAIETDSFSCRNFSCRYLHYRFLL